MSSDDDKLMSNRDFAKLVACILGALGLVLLPLFSTLGKANTNPLPQQIECESRNGKFLVFDQYRFSDPRRYVCIRKDSIIDITKRNKNAAN